MKESTNSEPQCIARARALVDVLNQSDAVRRARKAELETLQLDSLIDKKAPLDPEVEAQRAGDYVRIEMLLRIADRGFAGASERANQLAGEIIDLMIPIERKLVELNRANIEMARQYVARNLAKWYGEYDLPAAVGRAKIFLAEVQFAPDHQPATSYYCDESQDAKGGAVYNCRSLSGLLRVYDKARENVEAVEEHAEELKRALR